MYCTVYSIHPHVKVPGAAGSVRGRGRRGSVCGHVQRAADERGAGGAHHPLQCRGPVRPPQEGGQVLLRSGGPAGRSLHREPAH